MAISKQYIAERYEIRKLIGQGGMADVYLAYDLILNREVAIKILRNYLAEDPIYIQRFQREATAAATLTHKNIVQIYDVGEDEGYHYIVMEYVPDATLKDLIRRRGALHVEEAIDIMHQLVSGVNVAHRHSIIHRDLKPQNILMTHGGYVKIADFGIAMVQSVSQVTQNETIMGSLHYLAPELARGEKATAQSDIYSLGIIFYELLRGDVPFNANTAVNIALKHMRDEIPSIKEFNPTIPQSVENIIIKATAKNLNERYKNAYEMLEDLENALSNPDQKKLVLSNIIYNENDNTTVVAKRMGQDNETSQEDSTRLKRIEEAKKQKKKKNIIAGSIIGVIAVVLVVIVILLINGLGNSSKVKTITVPDLLNLTAEEAKVKLEEVGLVLDDSYSLYGVSDTIEVGKVMDYTSKGEEVKLGTKISVTISKGKVIVIGNYVGRTIDNATTELEALGVKVITKEVSSEDHAAGIVIEQSISEGKTIQPDAEIKQITLTVSTGYSNTMKDVRGWSIDSAKKELENAGFIVVLEILPAPTTVAEVNAMQLNVVIEQSIAGGLIVTEKNTTVILYYHKTTPTLPNNNNNNNNNNSQNQSTGDDSSDD